MTSEKSTVSKKEYKITVVRDRCKGCGLCSHFCKRKSLVMGTEVNSIGCFYAEVVNHETCNGCGICYAVCPDMAIKIERVEKED